MNGFGKRLKAAMLAAGIDTPPRLAKACGVSRQTVNNWLAMDTAELSAEMVYVVARVLKVRVVWLVAEEGGNPGWEHFERAMDILSRLPGEQADEWLSIGKRMAG